MTFSPHDLRAVASGLAFASVRYADLAALAAEYSPVRSRRWRMQAEEAAELAKRAITEANDAPACACFTTHATGEAERFACCLHDDAQGEEQV